MLKISQKIWTIFFIQKSAKQTSIKPSEIIEDWTKQQDQNLK